MAKKGHVSFLRKPGRSKKPPPLWLQRKV